LGAFLNGSGYGIVTRVPWAVSFPNVDGPRHPTQIYALGLFLLLTIVLYKVSLKYRTYEWYRAGKNTARAGLAFSVFLAGLGLINVAMAGLTPVIKFIAGYSLRGWAGLLLTVLGVGLGYLRSGRKMEDDLRKLVAYRPKLKSLPKIPKRARKKRQRGLTAGIDARRRSR
jgi:prolipoprotein diacylglyceryltransferase